MKKGFNSKKYIEAQILEVLKRSIGFERLYLEFGGKLIYDMHASRVLPGYKKTTKINLLKKLGDIEIIYCVNARDLESRRILKDFNLTYEEQVLKDIKDIEKTKLKVGYIVITRYSGERKALGLKRKFEKKKKKVFFHFEILGYPNDMPKVLEGFSRQSYFPVKKKIIVVTGTAGGSGKMAVCLSQIYHELKQGMKTSFSKFETFPVWDLPINHPVNIAYEAATADLQDKNMIDPYYKRAHNKNAVNYNRDIENFKILKDIFSEISNRKNLFKFKSPTEMGINMISKGITNDAVCRKAAIKEIKRRYKIYYREFLEGRESGKTIKRMKELLKKVD
jgi:uncharacterized protein (UPF0371 family)